MSEYDLKAIMYPAYDTPHKLCNIRGDSNIQQPRFPPNDARRLGDALVQMPPRLAQVESRVILCSIMFSREHGEGRSKREGWIDPGVL